MPALPAVNKVLRVVFQFTSGSNTRIQDRVYWAFTGPGPTVTDLTTLAGTVATAWANNLSAQQNPGTTLTGLLLTDLTSATGAQTPFTTSKVGTGGAGEIAAGSAAIIRFKIARRYRGGHPRFYFPGVPGSVVVTTPQITAAYAAALSAAWSAFIMGAFTTPPTNLGTLTHVNVSYFSGFTNKTFPSGRIHPVPTLKGVPTTDLVVGVTVNPNLGSQRRRNLQSA